MFLRRAAVSFPRASKFFTTHNNHDSANLISELNQEMAAIFGEPPPSELAPASIKNDFVAQDQLCGESPTLRRSMVQRPQFVSEKVDETVVGLGLTHVGSNGEARMVDVSPKEDTKRIAVASCKVILGKKVFDMVLANQMAKGDVLTVAKIAGINGAKQTSNLIPLCHNITLSNVRVDLALNSDDQSVDIEGEAVSTGKTGVEMEAMTAVTVAGLTVYDMCKAASKGIEITDVRLERKYGGKSGYWSRNDD